MNEKKCPPLLIGLLGFLLGVIVAKLAMRFCPLCRDAACCCCADDGDQGCCCSDDACTCEEHETETVAEPAAEPEA